MPACHLVLVPPPLGLCPDPALALCHADGSGDPPAVQLAGWQIARQGRQSDLQDRRGRQGRLVHLCRLRPLHRELPAMPRAGRARIDLCAVAGQFAEAPRATPTFSRRSRAARQDVSASQHLVMPALGENKNVMCYIDAIYVYLRARADGAVGRGARTKHEPKPAGVCDQGRGRVHGLTVMPCDASAHRICAVAARDVFLLASRAQAQAPGLGALGGTGRSARCSGSAPTRATCHSPTRQGEGFENKLAELLASKLNEPVSYTYYPQVDRLRAQHAERAALRRGDGRVAGRRPRADDQSRTTTRPMRSIFKPG